MLVFHNCHDDQSVSDESHHSDDDVRDNKQYTDTCKLCEILVVSKHFVKTELRGGSTSFYVNTTAIP